jgi:hypothetical protein
MALVQGEDGGARREGVKVDDRGPDLIEDRAKRRRGLWPAIPVETFDIGDIRRYGIPIDVEAIVSVAGVPRAGRGHHGGHAKAF